MEALREKPALLASPFAGDALTLRSPPHNFEAEVQLLGAILTNNRAFEMVADFLRPDHFADDRHARIFEACGKLINRSQIASATSLKNYFEQDATLAQIGGVPYLAKLAAAAVTIINAGDHGKLILDLFLRRQLIAVGEDIVNRAYAHDLETGAREQIEKAEGQLFALAETGAPTKSAIRLVTAVREAMDDANEAGRRGTGLIGIATGLDRIDGMTGGLEPGNVYVVAGRPSMGKTALATRLMWGASKLGHRSLLFSAEMSAKQIGRRVAAALAGLDLMLVKTGKLSAGDWQVLMACERELAELPFLIDDTSRPTVAYMKSVARRIKARGGLSLLVADHLHIFGPDPSLRSNANTVEIVGRNSGLMKALAKELGVPVLLLVQLSRANETRDDKRPQLSDLRWSGDIEQDADVVMFVHREHYYLERSKPVQGPKQSALQHADDMDKWELACREHAGKADIIFAKQRDGAIGTVQLLFDDRLAWFRNMGRGD